mgnify:CR=1 FL=1
MRKDLVVPIYKGISEQAGAKIKEDPNNDYPAKMDASILETHLKIKLEMTS